METRIKLTALETKIMFHRLECDGLDEALEEEFKLNLIEQVSGEIYNSMGNDAIATINTEKADTINPEVTTAVLVECIEGSTYIGTMIAIESDAKINATIHSMTQLARKIETARGLEAGSIVDPNC